MNFGHNFMSFDTSWWHIQYLQAPEGVSVAMEDDEFYMIDFSTERTTALKTNTFDSASCLTVQYVFSALLQRAILSMAVIAKSHQYLLRLLMI